MPFYFFFIFLYLQISLFQHPIQRNNLKCLQRQLPFLFVPDLATALDAINVINQLSYMYMIEHNNAEDASILFWVTSNNCISSYQMIAIFSRERLLWIFVNFDGYCTWDLAESTDLPNPWHHSNKIIVEKCWNLQKINIFDFLNIKPSSAKSRTFLPRFPLFLTTAFPS